MHDELRAELLERAGRDQAARKSLRPGHTIGEWMEVVEPVDQANTARLREIVAEHGWPGRALVGCGGLEPESENRARIMASEGPAESEEPGQPV